MGTIVDFFKEHLVYVVMCILAALVTVGLMLLLQSIRAHKEEARKDVFRVVSLDENTVDPEVWGKDYPRQYDGYRHTVDMERTKYGGSEGYQKLDADPRLKTIFDGHAFSVDYREARGHAYMLSDQDMTKRIKVKKQPGACLHCHSSIIPAYREAGIKAGVPGGDRRRNEQIMKGFEVVCAMGYDDARKLVSHPMTCIDCHDPKTMQLRVTRPGFLNGIKELAKSNEPLPHLPSIERWRKEGSHGEYDANSMATRQEMRSFVCGQCHVEYYFKGKGTLLTYPWRKGVKVEEIEAYYDEEGFSDWSHKRSGASALKAQHPEFELWSQGIHAQSGVACADCHMPYVREGAIKISNHHVRSPLLSISQSCQVCHRFAESELKARVETIQDKTKALQDRAEDSLVALITEIEKAKKKGVPQEKLKGACELQRKAQWRLDFVASENSMGFHAPQEAARILGEAIDYAGQGRIEVLKAKGK